MEGPVCPRCKAARASRARRVGFLQSFVFPQIGLYPWECGACRNIFLARTRGKLKRKRRPEGEPRLPPIPPAS